MRWLWHLPQSFTKEPSKLIWATTKGRIQDPNTGTRMKAGSWNRGTRVLTLPLPFLRPPDPALCLPTEERTLIHLAGFYADWNSTSAGIYCNWRSATFQKLERCYQTISENTLLSIFLWKHAEHVRVLALHMCKVTTLWLMDQPGAFTSGKEKPLYPDLRSWFPAFQLSLAPRVLFLFVCLLVLETQALPHSINLTQFHLGYFFVKLFE